MALQFCTACGSQLDSESKFCATCGGSVTKEVTPHFDKIIELQEAPVSIQPIKLALSNSEESSRVLIPTLSNLLGNHAYALEGSGEMVFDHVDHAPTSEITERVGPLKYLFRSISSFFKGFKETMKDKKKWIPLIVLALIWVIIPTVKYLGFEGAPVYYLSMLTFAEGGLYNGLAGAIGGVVGKGLIAAVVIQFFSALLSLKNPFSGMHKSIGTFFKSLFVKGTVGYSPLILGCGIALIAYNFMSSYAIPQNIMVGAAGFILSMKAIASKGGFIKGFYVSLVCKKKTANLGWINRFIAGLSTGFALSIGLSFFGQSIICYVVGSCLLIIGILIIIVAQFTRKEVIK